MLLVLVFVDNVLAVRITAFGVSSTFLNSKTLPGASTAETRNFDPNENHISSQSPLIYTAKVHRILLTAA